MYSTNSVLKTPALRLPRESGRARGDGEMQEEEMFFRDVALGPTFV